MIPGVWDRAGQLGSLVRYYVALRADGQADTPQARAAAELIDLLMAEAVKA